MLSKNAQQLIHDYLNLPFKGIQGVRCPYFNNARTKLRGQLRVLVGKGTPADILDEAHIISIQYHAGLFEHSGECCLHNKHTGAPVTADDLRKFLVDQQLGIECSGFVTHVLRAHYKETKGIDITKKLFITSPKNILRWFISKLRPIENIDVRVYANDRNSTQIMGKQAGFDYSKIQAGDVIVEIEKTKPFRCNHIMLITDVVPAKSTSPRAPLLAVPVLWREEKVQSPTANNPLSSLCPSSGGKRGTEGDVQSPTSQPPNIVLQYVHARAWASEEKYGHGVTEGRIKIINPGKSLLEQEWVEKGLAGEANETFAEAKTARILEIRRLNIDL